MAKYRLTVRSEEGLYVSVAAEMKAESKEEALLKMIRDLCAGRNPDWVAPEHRVTLERKEGDIWKVVEEI